MVVVQKTCTAQAQQTSHLAQARRTWICVAAEHGRLFIVQDWHHPGLTGFLLQLACLGPPCHYSLITKSGPHRGSECWPLRPIGEGRWTQFCKDTRAKRRI